LRGLRVDRDAFGGDGEAADAGRASGKWFVCEVWWVIGKVPQGRRRIRRCDRWRRGSRRNRTLYNDERKGAGIETIITKMGSQLIDRRARAEDRSGRHGDYAESGGQVADTGAFYDNSESQCWRR